MVVQDDQSTTKSAHICWSGAPKDISSCTIGFDIFYAIFQEISAFYHWF